ncbi:hypothetical protein BDBG_04752 [Blastomyces gilchristii SLH14081]|uniref:Zn(2)-C6 fungal-type domain-containing protein n=1 Tax=Blastomyces gilchristii (strain SLH14081) TaxID=559298 RepID=A0A179UPT4_BLAGS|nr:uncharacterized protein BDBG_04752 [Blastomyces gilchristii SLH14081]OAT09208.1 hypothetical protein BDBG_04752 [Blastomyces gilchristii SLH14081]
MSYPRKRALLACDFCRQRKRRCDASKPVCGNCSEAEAECRYQEIPIQSLESSTTSSAISRRLDSIETLLKSHSEAIAAISQQQVLETLCSPQEILDAQAVPTDAVTIEQPPVLDPSCVDGLNLTSPLNDNTQSSSPSMAAVSPEFTAQLEGSIELLAPFTIPPKHWTSSSSSSSLSSSVNNLLKLPIIKSVVGEFPDDYFFSIESRQVTPALGGSWMSSQVELPDIENDVTDRLVDTFFSEVHPCHPILARDEFCTMYANVMSDGLGFNLQSAFCLVVFALGDVASESEGVDPRVQYWEPALKYFRPALSILMAESAFSFGSDLLLPQALIFGGICFAYLGKPLHSWKLIFMASTEVQLLLSRSKYADADESYKERISETCWSCFLIECDYLSELNLPPSGIQTVVDDMALPKAGNPSDREGLSYLAEISMRSLLNRVLSPLSLSSDFESCWLSDESEVPQALTITSELDQQLLLWYNSIPESIKPTLGLGPTAHPYERILRIRYYQARYIIHRRFVLYSVSLPEEREPSQEILKKAQVCIDSCRLYLQNTGEILKKPSQYTWTVAQSSLAAALLLTAASLSRHLQHVVPDILPLQQLLIDNIAGWAAPESSFESLLCILGDIVRKQQFH